MEKKDEEGGFLFFCFIVPMFLTAILKDELHLGLWEGIFCFFGCAAIMSVAVTIVLFKIEQKKYKKNRGAHEMGKGKKIEHYKPESNFRPTKQDTTTFIHTEYDRIIKEYPLGLKEWNKTIVNKPIDNYEKLVVYNENKIKQLEQLMMNYNRIKALFPLGYDEWYRNLPANKATNCIEWAVKEEQIIKQLEQDYLDKIKKENEAKIAREEEQRKQQEEEKRRKRQKEYNRIKGEFPHGFSMWENNHLDLLETDRMYLALFEKEKIIQLEEEHLKSEYDKIVEQYPHGWHEWDKTLNKDNIESYLCLTVKNEKTIKQLEDEWQEKEKKIREEQEEASTSKVETLSRYDEMNEIRSEYDNEKLIQRLGFHYGYTPYYYFYDYYPQNHYPILSSRNMQIRKSIYAFKDCKPNNWANIMTAKIRWIFGNKLNKIVFVCIPASTQETTQRRYKNFMEHVCQKTGLLNGYDYVRITKEGDAKHLGGENEGDYECDKDFFEDRFVIVFDDIFTRGDSLRKMRTKLERVGAQVIAAFFLGKTVRRDEFKESKVHPWEVDIINPQRIQIRSLGYDEDDDEEERDHVEA